MLGSPILKNNMVVSSATSQVCLGGAMQDVWHHHSAQMPAAGFHLSACCVPVFQHSGQHGKYRAYCQRSRCVKTTVFENGPDLPQRERL